MYDKRRTVVKCKQNYALYGKSNFFPPIPKS